jgi:hypothetical protein
MEVNRMQKVSKILILSMVLVFCFSLVAQAKLVDVITFPGTTSPNTVTFDPAGANAKETVKTFDPWFKLLTIDDFRTDKDGNAQFQSTWNITNNTGIVWTDYHWGIVLDLGTEAVADDSTLIPGGEIGSTYFGTPNNSNIFKTQTPTDQQIMGGALTKTLDYQDGLVNFSPNNPDQVNFTLNFLITGLTPNTDYDNYQLEIVQFPTNTAPPPGAPIPGSLLLLGSGVLGLVGLRWKL